jgi:hypothetical protein
MQLNSAQISFAAGDTDAVALCQQVTFDDGSTWVGPDGTNPDCPAATVAGPPIIDQVVALVEAILNAVQAIADRFAQQFVDPVVCPIFIALGTIAGGGILGVLRINADGDVYVANVTGIGYTREYDCPPY